MPIELLLLVSIIISASPKCSNTETPLCSALDGLDGDASEAEVTMVDVFFFILSEEHES